MNQILLDSNFLYTLYDPKDKLYRSSQAFAIKNQGKFAPLIPEITLHEVTFLFRRSWGSLGEAKFLREFSLVQSPLVSVTYADLLRAADIMDIYRFDFVDCAIMALAERLNITQICTYDRRDFSIYRSSHCDYFELLP